MSLAVVVTFPIEPGRVQSPAMNEAFWKNVSRNATFAYICL